MKLSPPTRIPLALQIETREPALAAFPQRRVSRVAGCLALSGVS